MEVTRVGGFEMQKSRVVEFTVRLSELRKAQKQLLVNRAHLRKKIARICSSPLVLRPFVLLEQCTKLLLAEASPGQ